MSSRLVRGALTIGAAALAVAAAPVAAAPVAGADPTDQPAPPPPFNVNALAPVKPSDFIMQGDLYGFVVPGGITCVMSRASGGYGCSGAIPAAPDGANAVTGDQQGPPGFTATDRPLYISETTPKPLPAGSRISFRNVTCGTDGTATSCINGFNQSGFVISPAASYVLNVTNPLLDRPKGTNPYFN